MATSGSQEGSSYKFMKVHCKRMLQLIHFHLYSHIFEMKADQDEVLRGDTALAQVCHQGNFVVNTSLLKEAQRYRDAVVANLIKDGWMDQAITLLEQNRTCQEMLSREQGRPSEYFKYELQILNHSKVLSRQERCRRFSELLALSFVEDDDALVEDVVGANLLWARAAFNVPPGHQVPVNQWVKLNVELFTKLKAEDQVDIETISCEFNEKSFDFVADGSCLNRDGPITLFQDLYLDD